MEGYHQRGELWTDLPELVRRRCTACGSAGEDDVLFDDLRREKGEKMFGPEAIGLLGTGGGRLLLERLHAPAVSGASRIGGAGVLFGLYKGPGIFDLEHGRYLCNYRKNHAIDPDICHEAPMYRSRILRRLSLSERCLFVFV